MDAQGLPPTRVRLEINTNRWDSGDPSGVCGLVAKALRLVPEIEVVETDLIPRQCIAISGQVVATLDEYDAWQTTLEGGRDDYSHFMEVLQPPLILKQQYRQGARYRAGTLSAGFLIPSHALQLPVGSTHGERRIDVSARMRIDEYRAAAQPWPWMGARLEIVKQARSMAERGYASRWGRAPHEQYIEELYHTKIGFNWQGFGRLTYRILEYLRAGVVMLTQPLGEEWPIREDVVLEDGITCCFCERPESFAHEAMLLLRDRGKMARIQRNGLELWRERLALPAMGRWYWERIARAAGLHGGRMGGR
jgi:hypothetical protein